MDTYRFLAIDQGNSFFKLTLFVEGEVVKTCRIPTGDAEDVFAVLEQWKPGCAAFCSVGRLDSRMVESLRMAVDGNLLVLSHSTPLPISVDYSTPDTLGLDRVALAVGASSLYKDENLAVVDAGTAVTLDIVNSAPAFMGGRISPGIWLRMESLHQYTAALPLVDIDGKLPLAGDSTESSIRSGVILGLADEIVETFNQFNKSFGCTRMILTGGDSELLFKCISSRIPAVHVSDLMAKGLLYIYKYNETN